MIKPLTGPIKWAFVLLSIWSIGLGTNAQGEALRLILTGDVKGRANSNDFRNTENIQTLLGRGDQAEVLDVRKFNSGNFALKVKVLDVRNPGRPGYAGREQVTWIYYDRFEPWMVLRNKNGQRVQDPIAKLIAEMTVDDVPGTARPTEIRPSVTVPASPQVAPSPARPSVNPSRPAQRPQTYARPSGTPPRPSIDDEAIADALNTVTGVANQGMATQGCNDPAVCGPGVRRDSNLQARERQTRIKGEVLVEWDECAEGQGIRGRGQRGQYDPSVRQTNHCSKKRLISRDFLEFMDRKLPHCVGQAAAWLGVPSNQIDDIQITHNNIYQENSSVCSGRGCRYSFHATGRAMDFGLMHLKLKDGRTVPVDYRKAARNSSSPENKFYRGLRNCWEAANAARGCKPIRGYGHRCSMGHEHSGHSTHLHLSFPYCPEDKRGFGSI